MHARAHTGTNASAFEPTESGRRAWRRAAGGSTQIVMQMHCLLRHGEGKCTHASHARTHTSACALACVLTTACVALAKTCGHCVCCMCACARARDHAGAGVRVCVRVCMRACMRAYARACVPRCVRACELMRVCVCVCTCVRACELMRVCVLRSCLAATNVERGVLR